MNDIAAPLTNDRPPMNAEQFVHLRVLEWAITTARHYASDGHGGRIVHDLLDAIHNTPAHILGEFCSDQDIYPVMYRRFDMSHAAILRQSLRDVMQVALDEYRDKHGQTL